MANPQTENGYTRIANEIIDNLAKYRLSGEEWMVLLVIWRNTYGFQKLHGNITLGQFSLSTGLKKPTVYRALSKMITKSIIKKDNETYSFVKDFDTWKALSKKITIIKKDNEPLSKKITPTLSKEIIKKDKHLDFVYLTTEEHTKLQERFGASLPEKIESLNNYIGSRGKKYHSHYHTILSWAKKDTKQAPKTGKRTPEELKALEAQVMGAK